jgi:hypothetical protein
VKKKYYCKTPAVPAEFARERNSRLERQRKRGRITIQQKVAENLSKDGDRFLQWRRNPTAIALGDNDRGTDQASGCTTRISTLPSTDRTERVSKGFVQGYVRSRVGDIVVVSRSCARRSGQRVGILSVVIL